MEVTTKEIERAIIMSLISRKNMCIRGDRINEEREALEEYLQLIKALTEGTKSIITEEKIEFTPGMLKGGIIEFNCKYNTVPEILVNILPVCGLCKHPVRLRIKGVTNTGQNDGLSIDAVKSVHCKILSQFGVNTEIRINRRAIHPSVDGEVLFLAETVSSLVPVHMNRREQLERIASVNYSARIPSDVLNRVTNLHRDMLKPITPSIKVYNDICNKKNSGESPGYGSLIVAMGRNSIYYEEYTVDGNESILESPPEKKSKETVKNLLKSVRKSGGYDWKTQPFLFMLLPLTSPDASVVLIRRIDRKGKEILDLLNKTLNYTYRIERYKMSEQDIEAGVSSDLLVIKSFGVGYANIYKPGH